MGESRRWTTQRTAFRRFEPAEGPGQDLSYDVIVLAPGSIARTVPIPGLAEQGIGFRTVAEAIYLRNQVLSRLDLAASSHDNLLRRRALTFVFIGAGTPSGRSPR